MFFSSPARAHTEHMLATRFSRPRADDEIAHTAIIIITVVIVVPLNQINDLTLILRQIDFQH